MKLTELYPEFIKVVDERSHKRVDSLGEAAGIRFLCPIHLRENKMNPEGVHSVIIWCTNVPLKNHPGPGRWDFYGTGYSDLTIGWPGKSIVLGQCFTDLYSRAPFNEEFWIDKGSVVFSNEY